MQVILIVLMAGLFVVSMADPFAEEDTGKGKGYVHVRVQQRNGRKSLTTVQGLKKEYDYNKILRKFKKVR